MRYGFIGLVLVTLSIANAAAESLPRHSSLPVLRGFKLTGERINPTPLRLLGQRPLLPHPMKILQHRTFKPLGGNLVKRPKSLKQLNHISKAGLPSSQNPVGTKTGSNQPAPGQPGRQNPVAVLPGINQPGATLPGSNGPTPILHGGPVGVIVIGTSLPILIQGAGGGRLPIAPVFVPASDRDPEEVASALVRKKRHRPAEILVEVGPGLPENFKQDLARRYGVSVQDEGILRFSGNRLLSLTVRHNRNLRALLSRLFLLKGVLSAQPNYVYAPVQGTSGKSLGPSTSQPEKSVRESQELPSGKGVKLAIIDTCLDKQHVELQGSIVSSFDATRAASEACAPENHGTAVASLIAGHRQIHGTAAGVEILEARAFSYKADDEQVDATTREVVKAIDWAATSDAKVMNLSFAGPADPIMERVIAAAYTKGIVLVGAAGNGGPHAEPLYPGAYPEVIAVTATNGKRQLYRSANRGKYIAVSARGVDVLVAHVHDTYGTDSGTSFAAAEVSGVVASLLEKRPNATPEQIRAALQDTAATVSGLEKDEVGHGAINAVAAIDFVEKSIPQK